MKIDTCSIGMQSWYNHVEEYSKQESLIISGGGPTDFERSANGSILEGPDILDLSERARRFLTDPSLAQTAQTEREPVEIEIKLSSEDEQKITLIQKMIEKLTGKKIKFFISEKFKLHNDGSAELMLRGRNLSINPQQSRPQWGIRYDKVESYYEREAQTFSSSGIVTTADGKKIEFFVKLNMSREFALSNEVHFEAGTVAVDPLVINFSGNAAGLSSTKFDFDLDSDGARDRISFVEAGSGFLTLDLNNDGTVNNGRELFGPISGNGFSELEDYDSDGNSWIDENDPIFDRLQIWTKDERGNDILFALGEKGVGAIYLGSIATHFQMKDESNQMHGKVASTGIYLSENGSAGTIQQIDLVV